MYRRTRFTKLYNTQCVRRIIVLGIVTATLVAVVIAISNSNRNRNNKSCKSNMTVAV